MVARTYDLKDTLVIDIAAAEAGLPLTDVPDFFVQSIRNIAFLKRPGDYPISLFARGVDTNSDQKADISVSIDGKPQVLSRIDHVQAGRADIFIPQAALDPLFKRDQLSTVAILISVKLSKRHLFGLYWSEETFSIPLTLTLYPQLAAKIVVKSQAPKYDWVSVEEVASNPVGPTPDLDGCTDLDCRFTGYGDVRVPGPQSGDPIPGARRIRDPYWICLTPASYCAFFENSPIVVDMNGTHASGTFQTWSKPTTWQLRGKVDEWRQTAIQTNETEITLYFDDQSAFEVPSQTLQISLQVTTFTGRTYTMSLPGSDPDGIVVMGSRAAGTPGNDRIVIYAGRPIGVP